MNPHTATFGIFHNSNEVQKAVTSLKSLGFRETEITVVYPDHKGAQDFEVVHKMQWKNGAIIGAVLGAMLVYALAIFITTEFYTSTDGATIFGVSRFSILLGSLALGALAGAACGTLVGIGTPDPAGKRYGQYMHVGGILVSVRSDESEKIKEAHNALEQAGGMDIHSIDEEKGWNTALHEKSERNHEEIVEQIENARAKELL